MHEHSSFLSSHVTKPGFRDDKTGFSLEQNTTFVEDAGHRAHGSVPRAAGRGAVGPGLVHSQTSVPNLSPNPKAILVDRQASRLKKLRSSVLTAARLHVEQKSKWKVAMLTPTYAPDSEWSPNQIASLLRHIRKWLTRKGVEFRYVWVQELTKKGRPHYHVLIWLPFGLSLPKPDKQGWWPHGMTKIEWARNAVGYIAKYASKGKDYQEFGQFAKGARLHGNGGITGSARLEQQWWKLPAWLRTNVAPEDRYAPRKGGGYASKETGEWRESPWLVIFHMGQVFIQPKGVA